MSSPADSHSEVHTGPVKTPTQFLQMAFFAFVLPVFIIIGLVWFITSGSKPSNNPENALSGLSEQDRAREMNQRLQKVGSVEIRDANRPPRSGKEVYESQCAACHATGASGAPKFGDAGAWGPRIAQGFETLVKSALQGKGGMGAQAGGEATDFEISRAVAYLTAAAGGKFEEPAAPAAGQAAAIDGKALYEQTCGTCHTAGVAGAPKFGDKAAWSARLGAGVDGLTASAIKGKGAMPPKGGASYDDAQMKAAVQYMVDAVK